MFLVVNDEKSARSSTHCLLILLSCNIIDDHGIIRTNICQVEKCLPFQCISGTMPHHLSSVSVIHMTSSKAPIFDQPGLSLGMPTQELQRSPKKPPTIFEQFDTKNREFAKALHDTAYIYALYGLLDGLSLSYSMIKYCFDLKFSNSSVNTSDIMHDWMVSPTGIAITAVESITIIAFSFMANVFKDDDENALKKYIAIAWPYGRDSMKALKNAYKGFRSTLQAVGILGHIDLRYLMIPFGVAFGALSVLNRMFYRWMKDERISMQGEYETLYNEMMEKDDFRKIEKADFDRFKSSLTKGQQSKELRALALLSASFAGLVDGLYLFMGVLTISVLSPQLFVAMTVFSGIFALACIATRAYEEHDYQCKLIAAQTKAALGFSKKELEAAFRNLKETADQLAKQSDMSTAPFKELSESERQVIAQIKRGLEEDLKRFKEELDEKSAAFFEKRKECRSLRTLPTISMILAGIKSGLMAYSGIASVLFAVATVNAIFAVALPPAFLVTCVSLGLACLIAFPVYMVMNQKTSGKADDAAMLDGMCEGMRANFDNNSRELLTVLSELKAGRTRTIELPKIEKALEKAMDLDSTPQFVIQEWFEVARSLFSGLAKGQKAVDYMFNPMLVSDDSGHYKESTPMLWLTVVSVCCYVPVLALRAYARAFNRINPVKVDDEESLSAVSQAPTDSGYVPLNDASASPTPSLPAVQQSRPATAIAYAASAADFGLFNAGRRFSRSQSAAGVLTLVDNHLPLAASAPV